MNRQDVVEILTPAEVDPTLYSVVGERDDQLSLVAWGQQCQVFYSERGRRYDERTFDDEDAACVYFLKRLFTTVRPFPN
jgi:hypothetical protein